MGEVNIIAEITTVSLIVVGLLAAAAAAAAYLLQPDTKKAPKQQTFDQTPPNITYRGAWLPKVMGRRMVGCIVNWCGDRTTFTETVEQGGGGGKDMGGGDIPSVEQIIYFETAVHSLCIGPAWKLHGIYMNEENVLNQPITRDDTPSGSAVALADGSTIKIYWGECNQPINGFLGEKFKFKVGDTEYPINSRWPNICYILYNKNLGTTTNWPTIQYDIECRSEAADETISTAPDWIPESDDGYFDDGYNPAHAIWELATAPFPQGLGMSADHFDHGGFETMAKLCYREHLPVNMMIGDGENAAVVIEELMRDVGFFTPQVGDKIKPYMIRPVPSDILLPEFTDDMDLDNEPEEEKVHGNFMPDRPVFIFRDKTLMFKSNTVPMDNDAQARQNGRPQTAPVELRNITDWRTSFLVSRRRQTELSTNGHTFNRTGTRDMILPDFHPGMAFRAGGDQYRLASKDIADDTSAVKIEAVLDQYSLGASTYVGDANGVGQSALGPMQDLAWQPIVFGMDHPLNPDPTRGACLIVPRVRAHSRISGARIYASASPTGPWSYIGRQTMYSQGGDLMRPMTDTEGLDECLPGVPGGDPIECVGPTVEAWNELDNQTAMDLTGNDPAYNDPQQLVTVGDELFKVRALTPVSGGWELVGLTRAQYTSEPEAHAVGDDAIVFQMGRVTPIFSSVLVGGTTVYVKSVPYTAKSTVDPAGVTAKSVYVPSGSEEPPLDPPAAPSGFSATTVSDTEIALAWTDNSDNETGFEIQRKTGSGGTYSLIHTTAADATSYNNTGLTASTEYYYRVRAVNGDGNSAYATEDNATTDAPAPVSLIDPLSSGSSAQGTAIYSNQNSGQEAWKAFDGSGATMWNAGGSSTPQFLGFQWTDGDAATVTSYSITARSDSNPENTPTDWTLEGSNDGSSWTTLDTRSGEGSWSIGETRNYSVSSPSPYTYNRIYVTGFDGGWMAVAELEFFGSLAPAPTPSFTDDFNRADAGSLGTSSGGVAWSSITGSWGISSNQAYATGSGEHWAFGEVGDTDQEVEVTIANHSNGMGLCTRVTDASNHYMLHLSGGMMQIYKRVSGSWTMLLDDSGAITDGDVVKFTAVGNVLSGYLNDVLIVTTNDSTHTTGTLAGLYVGSPDSSHRFDDFSAVPV